MKLTALYEGAVAVPGMPRMASFADERWCG